MKKIIPFFLLCGCVTYPRYVTRYDCNPEQKDKLPDVTIECIDSVHQQKQREKVIDHCHSVALKTLCTPVAYFQRVAIPTFAVTADIPCTEAETFAESYICDGGE